MKLRSYLLEGNVITNALGRLRGMTFGRLKDFLKREFDKFVDIVKSEHIEPVIIKILSDKYDTRIRSLDDLKRMKIREGTELNEDLEHWWKLIKTEAFPSLSFYPVLQVWLEVDKVIKGQDMDEKATIIYGLIWVFLISGKYIKGWNDWKKQNPDEYQKERAAGKGGII